MQQVKKFLYTSMLSAVLASSLLCTDVQVQVADIFPKPVLPRVTEEKIKKDSGNRKSSFDRTRNTPYVLIPAALIGALVVAYKWDSVKRLASSGGDAVVDMGKNACNVGIFGYNWTIGLLAGQAKPFEDTPARIEAQDPLNDVELMKVRSMMHQYAFWSFMGGCASSSISGVLKSALMQSALTVYPYIFESGAQDIELFIKQSTKLPKIKTDLRMRYQRLQEPTGRSVIEHFRMLMYEWNETIINDTVRVIAFMYSLNDYNELDIASIETQTQLLMDEANDLATIIEYKLDEFDHTADNTKRQALLKEMIVKSLTFITILEAEVNSFAILANPDQD